MKRVLLPSIVCFILTSAVHASAQELATLQAICDQAAASPLDPSRPPTVPGVGPNKLVAEIAVPACQAASRAAPDDSRIAFQLGRAYFAAHKYAAAAAMYEKANEGGHVVAANNLAAQLADGRGVPKDVPRALELLTKAAESGLGLAARNLAVKYTSGIGVPKDYAKARYWYGEGVSANDTLSKEGLAYLLLNALGGPKDPDKARSLYTDAANAGSVHAQYMLGTSIIANFSSDEDTGVFWLQKAASAGSGPATMALGILNEFGSKKRAKNLGAARQYYEQASILDTDGARQALARLNGQPAENQGAVGQSGATSTNAGR